MRSCVLSMRFSGLTHTVGRQSFVAFQCSIVCWHHVSRGRPSADGHLGYVHRSATGNGAAVKGGGILSPTYCGWQVHFRLWAQVAHLQNEGDATQWPLAAKPSQLVLLDLREFLSSQSSPSSAPVLRDTCLGPLTCSHPALAHTPAPRGYPTHTAQPKRTHHGAWAGSALPRGPVPASAGPAVLLPVTSSHFK